MASTYSPKLRFELIGAGEQAGLWGTTTNKNVGQLIEQAIAGVTTVDLTGLTGNYTLTALDGAPDQSRSAVIKCTGIATGAINLIIPTQTKLYVVRNDCGQQLTVKTSAQVGGVVLDNGEATLVFCDGTNAILGLETAAAGTLGVDGGGTGVSSFTAGFVKSPGGTSALTTSSSISLTSDVSGILPVSSGGTGGVTFTAGRLLVGNGTSAFAELAGNTIGQVPTWTGTTWAATLPSSGVASVTASGSGISVSPTTGAVVVSNTGVTSFNTRTGAVTLSSGDVTGALGYTPYNGSTNPNGYITSSSLSGYVTTNTTQTITGEKTFTNGANFTGGNYIVSTFYNFNTSGTSMYWNGSEVRIDVAFSNRFGVASSYAYFDMSNVQKIGGGTFSSYSDRRYKQDITPYVKGINDLKQLNPVNYRYTAEFMHSTEPSQPFVGLIAQDVQSTSFADSVTVDAQGYCILDVNQMTFALINAVKQLSSEVDALKAEVAALKGS